MEHNNVNSFELSTTLSDMEEKANYLHENTSQDYHHDFIESGCFEQFNNTVIDYKLY